MFFSHTELAPATSHQSINSTFLSQQISISHRSQPAEQRELNILMLVTSFLTSLLNDVSYYTLSCSNSTFSWMLLAPSLTSILHLKKALIQRSEYLQSSSVLCVHFYYHQLCSFRRVKINRIIFIQGTINRITASDRGVFRLCSLHLHCIQPTIFLSHTKSAPVCIPHRFAWAHSSLPPLLCRAS